MSIRVTLNIARENTTDLSLGMDETAQAVCEKVLETEECPVDTEVSITYVNDEEIQEINRETRGMDAVTDVLSFPNLEFDDIAGRERWTTAMSSAWDCMDPESGNLFLGDIVLNLDRVRLQAAEYGHSEKREFAFLIAHSMLHLCGYDHMDPVGETCMFRRQEEVLTALGITRDDTE